MGRASVTRPLVIRAPWSDPSSVSWWEVSSPGGCLDLNQGFRDYLVSSSFLRQLADRAESDLRRLDQRATLDGAGAWDLYRSARLSCVLAGAIAEGGVRRDHQADYFHTLATTPCWYFNDRGAFANFEQKTENLAAEGAIGEIGAIFRAWVEGSDPLSVLAPDVPVEIPVDDAGQLPFVRILAGIFARKYPGRVIRIVAQPSVDPRLVTLLLGPLEATAASRASEIDPRPGALALVRKRLRGRALRVTWQPQSGTKVGGVLSATTARLSKRGIPVALTFAPGLRPGDRPAQAGGFIFDAIDEILSVEAQLSRVDVSARPAWAQRGYGEDLRSDWLFSELVRMQIFVELEGTASIRGKADTLSTVLAKKLVATRPRLVASRHDLHHIAARLGGTFLAREEPFGLGQPGLVERVRRAPKPTRYLLFPALPTVIPMVPDNATYGDLLKAFARPQRIGAVAEAFDASELGALLDLIDTLTNMGILRPA